MPEEKPGAYVASAHSYARDVVAGGKPACKWVRLACQRQLDDLVRQDDDDWPYRFDLEAAEKPCYFVELLPHIKGKWAGGLIVLEPWQLLILCAVFGWLHKQTGLRRFRTAYLEVPRKNAKSTLTSGLGLYLGFVDGEPGAEVYSAATTRDQARIVFGDAQAMTRKSPQFRSWCGVAVNAHNINQIRSASKFEPVSAEAGSLDGLNVHGGLIDELHAHKTRLVFDVMETATGSRTQSLLWLITTAGSNRAGICYEQRGYLLKLLTGVAKDETYFGVIYTTDEGDDWTAPATWAKANPNYGVSVYPEDIARLAAKAMQMPAAQNNFLTKRLNVWVNADTAWMDMLAWDRCASPSLTPEEFEGEPCYVAFDLASKIDIAARVQLFTRELDGAQHYYAFGRYYLPDETVEGNANSQYEGWRIEGRLIATPGNIIDFGYIEDDLRDIAARFLVREVPYDPYQATQFSTRMSDEGLPMVEMRPTVLNFSEPMKQLEALVRDGKFHHDGDPVLTWMVSNVVCHMDNKDNIYPRKERPENKIDGVVALIMAIGRALAGAGGSVYEARGIREL